MILTEQEREALKQEILQQIETASQGVDELPATETLEGVASLPAMRGTEVVSVPLALLTNPGEGNLAQQTGAGRTIAMSQAAVSAALSEKVDAVEGKGLSTCDYTTAERAKLSALPSTAYSRQQTYSRDEVDALVADRAGGSTPLSIERGEHIVGEWVDPLYGDRMALWEQVFELDAAALGDTSTSVTLSPSLPLEPDTWLRVVDASLVAEGAVYPASDAVVRIFQQGRALQAELRLPAGAAGVLALQVRYVKYAGDVLTFELKIPEAADLTGAALRFPMLKYFKKGVLTPCCDDSNTTAYCNLHAFINRRKRWNTPGKKYFHKGWKPSADDTFTLYEPLDFSNGTGRRIRYGFSCALWPSWGNEQSERFIRDSSDSTYNPYICWDELREMQDYGVSMLYHNVDERLYDKTDPRRIAAGLAADRQRVHEKLGVWMKLMGQPDGNEAYIEAARSTPVVQMMRQSAPTAQPVHLLQAQELYHRGVRSSYSTGNEAKLAEIAEQMAAADPRWVGVTWHETNWEGEYYDFFKALYDTYSAAEATDTLWVASWDAVYEWMHTRLRGSVEVLADAVRTEGGFRYVPCRVLVPGRESFDHRDASLLFTAAGLPASCEVVNCSSNVLRAESAVAADGVRLNLNFDARTLERAERYTARFEATADEQDREAAEYFVSWLSDALAAPFRERIGAVGAVEIESLTFAGPATLEVGANGIFTVTALPASNTQMEQIELTIPAAMELVSRSIEGNVLTAVVRGVTAGSGTLRASVGALTEHFPVLIREPGGEPVPITSLSIEGPASIAGTEPVEYTVTALPADTTQMEEVQVSVNGGIREVGRSTAGNVITVVVEATANGDASLSAFTEGLSDRVTLKSITVTGVDTPQLSDTISIIGGTDMAGVSLEAGFDIPATGDGASVNVTFGPAADGAATATVSKNSLMQVLGYSGQMHNVFPGKQLKVSLTHSSARLEATAAIVTGEIVLRLVEPAPLRIVASFGYDHTVATGGVYNPDGGYTKIRVLSTTLTGKLYDTRGNHAGNYLFSGVPKTPGASFFGPATGDNSALYRDYAIQSCLYAGADLESHLSIGFSGLPAGRYRMRYFLNTANAAFSRGAVEARWKFITTEGEYPIRMPAQNDYWLNNWEHCVDTEIVIGSDGRCFLEVDAAGNASTSAPVQIIDIEQLPDAPAVPYRLRLNGADGDLTLADQPAGGVTLQVAVETNGTPRIVSSDSRLTVGTPPSNGNLSITVPPHTGNAPRQYAAVVVGITEDDTLRRSVTVTQKAPVPLPPVKLVTLTNDTSTSFVFFDSRGDVFSVDPNMDQMVQIGDNPCTIVFNGPLINVTIRPSNQPTVWAEMDIEAEREYTIDTTRWLEAIEAGTFRFSVLG